RARGVVWWGRDGHASAKLSYVLRPISKASALYSRSLAYVVWSSVQKVIDQCWGSWIWPSRDTYVELMILRIFKVLSVWGSGFCRRTQCDSQRRYGKTVPEAPYGLLTVPP